MPINKLFLADFLPGVYFHVLNRTNNKEALFLDTEDREMFLSGLQRYSLGFFDICAFCLLDNHFHLLIRTKKIVEIEKHLTVYEGRLGRAHHNFLTSEDKLSVYHSILEIQLRKFFISYSLAFNRSYGRNGNLFHRQFKRVLVESETQLKYLYFYIHYNPAKHGLMAEYELYNWSSYRLIMDGDDDIIEVKAAIELFGSLKEFEKYHRKNWDKSLVKNNFLEY